MVAEPLGFSGRYQIIRELGRGGLGVVVLARHIALDRLVAIKRIAAGFSVDADAHQRFQREAQVLGRLHHEHIVKVYDFAHDGLDALIVMEYVDGQNLDQRMATHAPDAGFSLRVIAEIAAALEHSHAHGIVHLDLKPSNVLIDPDGRAKVADFGLARLLAAPTVWRPDRPNALLMAGTPGYMAPEQIRGDTIPDARSDAYALAATAYLLLTGVPPFPLTGRAALLEAHLHATPLSPAEALPGFPKTASEAIIAGLAKDPRKRSTIAKIASRLAELAPEAYPTAKTITTTPTARDEPPPTEGARAGNDIIVIRHDPTPSGSSEPLALPVYSPPTVTRRRWALVVGLIAALAASTVLIRHATSHGPLKVNTIAVAVTPLVGSCPQATFTFTATLTTNGHTGPIQMQWLKPDGETTPQQVVHLLGGVNHARVSLKFTLDGTTPADLTATLNVLTPNRRTTSSPPAHYSC